MAIDPNILFQGGLANFQPVTSFMQGRQFAQQQAEAEQLRRMRQQQMGLADLQYQQAVQEQPYLQRMRELQQKKAEMGLAGLQQEQDIQQKMSQLGSEYISGNLTDQEFLNRAYSLRPQQLTSSIEQRRVQEAATQKYLAEEARKEREFALQEKKFSYEQQKDAINRQIDLMKPQIEYDFDQQKLASQLSDDLFKKKIPGRGLTQKQVEKVTESTVLTAPVLKQINDILGLIKDETVFGPLDKIPSKKKAELESKMRQLQIVYKGEQFAGLGVLTGPDLDLLNAITGDPTALFSLSAGNARAKLNSMKKNILSGYNTKLRQNNFNPFKEDELISTVPVISEKKQEPVNDLASPITYNGIQYDLDSAGMPIILEGY